MNDLRTVLWKEWREFRAQSGEFGPKTTAIMVISLLALVLGLAVLTGEFLVLSPILVVISWTPVLGVVGLVAEAFAGERERHTLETLLASRVRSEALLIGKILLHVIYGYGATLLLATLLTIGANAKHLTQRWTLPPLPSVLVIAGLTPLSLLFLTSLGALVSLRSPTVRQAQSRLILIVMGIFVSLVIVSKVAAQLASGNVARFVNTERGQLAIIATWFIALACADLALVLLAWARFQRDRLIEIH